MAQFTEEASGADASFLASLRTTASHTIGVQHLRELFHAVGPAANAPEYAAAVLEDNVLGRSTGAGRKRAFRHLREFYVLDPASPEFAVFRRLWELDTEAQPLLAGLMAYSRDELLRDSFAAIAAAPVGARLTSNDLADAAGQASGAGLSPASLAKVGRNTAACWTQTGHLTGRTSKCRVDANATPVNLVFAVILGHRAGRRGSLLLDSPWTALLDANPVQLRILLDETARAGLLDVRSAGHVLDIDVSPMTRDREVSK